MPLKSTEIFMVSCSYFNTYCLTNAGELLVWGANSNGQCGLPGEKGVKITPDTEVPLECKYLKDSYSPVPLLLESLKMIKFRQIVSNGEFAMALSVDGQVYVWGSNEQGQRGTGFVPKENYKESPKHLTVFKRIEMKSVNCGPYHSAFLAENGEVYMCGSSENGRLGLGETVMNPQNPYMACGVAHTIALDNTKKLWAWGSGWFGKLGLGDSDDRISPQEVKPESFYPNTEENIKEIACGEYHTLFLNNAGEVYAAGLAQYAGVELIGTNEVSYFNKVKKIKDVKHIAVGRDHSLVVTHRGQIYGWGKNNSGKLGRGKDEIEAEVIPCRQIIVRNDIVFDKIAAGSNHSAAVTTAGVVFVWGNSSSGRLGLGFNVEEIVFNPHEIESIKSWLDQNEVQQEDHTKPEGEEEEQYSLQSLLKNEPIEQSIETLLSQDQKIVVRLENLLMKFDQVRKVQQERENMLSYIESLIVAKIETIKSIANPDFKLTLPPIISKNFQIYEFLLACMQTHPCYMAKLVKHNPHLPTTEVAAVFKAIYGDMSNNSQKLRRLMLLYKLTLKISVENTEFHRSLKMKAGDLSAYIYFYLLRSQNCNNLFYSSLTAEIMKIVHKVTHHGDKKKKKKNIELEVKKEALDAPEDPIKEEIDPEQVNLEEEENVNAKIEKDAKMNEEIKLKILEEILQGKHKIKDALNYKQLEELGDVKDLPPELMNVYITRKDLYKTATKQVKNKIYDFLYSSPKVRKRIGSDKKLSDEVKFMYKDIPSVFRERFKEQCNSIEGRHILDSKVVLLFFAPLVEMLREPIRLKRVGLPEYKASIKQDIEIDDFIKVYSQSLNLIADYIEDLGEWKKNLQEPENTGRKKNKKPKTAADITKKQCQYRNSLVKELTNVSDINLTDLSLGDMLATSLEPEDSSLTISLEDICNLHLLLKSNLKIIRKHFGQDDPVYIIIESLGDVNDLFRKILSGDTKSTKLNLKLPIRWLLRERALQSCKECKTPLTYSLLRHPPDEKLSDIPLTVPILWRCWKCGNTQEGWHVKCSECQSLRRDFPEEALFKNFKQTYISEELDMFTQILYDIPPVPPHISRLKFLRDLKDKQPPGSYLLQNLKNLIERLEEIGDLDKDENQRAEENIARLETEANFEYEARRSHKAYLDTMNHILGTIEDKIKLVCLQYYQNTSLTLRVASIAIAKGKNTMDTGNATNKKSKRAQGRFTVDYLFKKRILDHLDLPETIRKNTSFYFTEVDDGAFDVRIVLREDRNYLCLPREPIEVKIMGFEIGVEKLKAMRRTMNFRAQTSFEMGKVTFNVFQFVRMLGSLLGKCKQGDFN